MAAILTGAIGSILANYADVIEGGNTHRGSGTVYRGIPGNYSNDPELINGNDTPLTVIGGLGKCSTTAFDVVSTKSWDTSRWVKDSIPAYWARCTVSGSAGSPNITQARKITGWNNTTKVFTVAPALDSTPIANDVFAIMRGFKRCPNNIDIESESQGIESGFDRFFSLSAIPGKELPIYGAGNSQYETQLVLTLRFQKYGKSQDDLASYLENLSILRQGLTRSANPDHRDGTYTVALLPDGGATEITKNDKNKIVAVDKYRLIYRIGAQLI